jgi:opacity protein-like surface antigen
VQRVETNILKEGKSMSKKSGILFFAMFFLLSFAAHGDDFSRFEIFGGYSMTRTSTPVIDAYAARLSGVDLFNLSFSDNPHRQFSKGAKFGVAYNFHKHIGIVGELGWSRTPNAYLAQLSDQSVPCVSGLCMKNQSIGMGSGDHSNKSLSILAGPRFSMNVRRMRPYAHVLIGWHRSSAGSHQDFSILQQWDNGSGTAYTTNHYQTNVTISPRAENSFAFAAGGGIDVNIQKGISLRLFEADVLNARDAAKSYSSVTTLRIDNNTSITSDYTRSLQSQASRINNLRLSFGVIFHLGYPK